MPRLQGDENKMLNIKNFYNMSHNYRTSQLFFSALKLDIFSYLDEPISSDEIANKTGYNLRNLKLLLNALTSVDIIEKENDTYKNTEESKKYLSKNSTYYVGASLLFRQEMMMLDNIEKRIKVGPDKGIKAHNEGYRVYDFAKLAEVNIPDLYLWHIEPLIKIADSIFQEKIPNKILDLGGGSGAMGIELAKKYSKSKVVIYEEQKVAEVAEKLVSKNNLESKISVLKGNFIEDDIGKDYDFIIASGIIDFAKDHLNSFVKKLYNALNKNGFIYLITHGYDDEKLEPSNIILGWLSSHLDGLDILLPEKIIESAMEKGGFKLYSINKASGFNVKVYQK
jgi:SAM-dependent methyltransferase